MSDVMIFARFILVIISERFNLVQSDKLISLWKKLLEQLWHASLQVDTLASRRFRTGAEVTGSRGK